MLKYDRVMDYNEMENNPLVDGEELIWRGEPKKKAYIINQIVVMMPIAIIWLLLDGSILIPMLKSGEMSFFMIPFFLIHLFPVWIWLGNVISANRRWKNTKYYVTDRRIIIQNGFFAENYQTIYYKDIRNVNLRVGLIDSLLKVGDIYFDLGEYQSNKGTREISSAFLDVENSREVYSRIQKIVMDIQTDIEYPNALRPDSNPGYNTKYNAKM